MYDHYLHTRAHLHKLLFPTNSSWPTKDKPSDAGRPERPNISTYTKLNLIVYIFRIKFRKHISALVFSYGNIWALKAKFIPGISVKPNYELFRGNKDGFWVTGDRLREERDAVIGERSKGMPWSVTYPTHECRVPEHRILTSCLDASVCVRNCVCVGLLEKLYLCACVREYSVSTGRGCGCVRYWAELLFFSCSD